MAGNIQRLNPEDARADPVISKEADGVVERIRSGVEWFRSLFRKALSEPERTHRFMADRELFFTEVAFIRGRDTEAQNPEARMAACDLLTKERYPIDRILAARDEAENLQIHEELSYLRNIYHSQIVTSEVGKAEAGVELHGLPRIEFLRFLTEKVFLCKNRGIHFDNNNLEDILLDDAELRLERIKREITLLLKEATIIGAEADDRTAVQAFNTSVAALLDQGIMGPELPTQAPELYKERQDRKEDPETFTRRVYAPWLGLGLHRAHVKELDKSLYQALYKRGLSDELAALLPTAQGRRIADLGRSDSDLLEARRESLRRADAKRRENTP
ncbi:hypothetical protein [Tritonibacter mobilis]|uniref:hypothetical protein n=1 Tax=Tritonibacter mobilis TaxID=379347 RepID=UPI000E0D8D98|nr:hypothetical protein [Tritonibacter mobilis]